MPLELMPNGEYVEIEDGTPPEVVARIKGQFKGKPRQQDKVSRVQSRNTRVLSDEDKEVVKRSKAGYERGDYGYMDRLVDGLSFNTADEIGAGITAGTVGVAKAIGKGDIGEIGKTYRVTRRTRNSMKRKFQEDNPVTGTLTEIGGSLLNPIGTGAKGVQAAGRGLAKILPKGGAQVTRLGRRMETAGPVAQGVMTGATTGALNAAGASESLEDLPGDAVTGAATGAVFGGGIGALGQLGSKGVQILKDRGSLGRFSGPGGQDGSRAAYARIAELLEKGDLTPAQAARRLKLTDARGGDGMVMDLTPGLTSEAGFVSRQTNLKTSNKLVERGQQRFDARRSRAATKVSDTAVLPPGAKDFDSYKLGDETAASRKARGQVDYREGGAMDTPITWNDELDDFFKNAPAETDDAMREAFKSLQRRRQDPNLVFTTNTKNGEPVVYPTNFRAWDAMKRAFDGKIGQALKAGKRDEAGALSDELNRLKGILSKQNPDYERILAAQRDKFQEERAIEIGNEAWKSIKTKPREALRSLRGLRDEELNNARVGVIDRFMDNIVQADDAMTVITQATRNEHQAKLLEWAFGGKKELAVFSRWAKRELKARNADSVTRYAGQSVTSRMKQAGASQGDLATIAGEGAAGGAFGGVAGIAANVGRKIRYMAGDISENAQEKIAQILMSKGDDLVPRIKEVTEYMAARRASNKSRARWLGKAAQQPFTTEIGGE